MRGRFPSLFRKNTGPLRVGLALGCALCLGGAVRAQDVVPDAGNHADAGVQGGEPPAAEPSVLQLNLRQQQVCNRLELDPVQLAGLIAKPLYEFDEAEVDVYLRYLSAYEPDLPKRIAHLARKNLGQPYEIYLLGEMPFEPYDPQPLYCLSKSDCLVFTEHTYAMALTDSWSGFMRMLQRIRYKDGKIGVATRNHYTESDWNPNNRWLVREITPELAPDRVVRFSQKVDRSGFLRKRYGLETAIPVEEAEHVFLRFEDIEWAKPHLRDGDFVNIVRGTPASAPAVEGGEPSGAADDPEGTAGTGAMRDLFGGSAWVGHTGLIVLGDGGEVHLIHSVKPQVREESIDDYIAQATANNAEKDAAGKARLLGFKFLRLHSDPWANLRELDGDAAPRVILPGGDDAGLW